MAFDACPVCGERSKKFEQLTPFDAVAYFRCQTCGHVWSQRVDDSDAPKRAVIQHAKKPPHEPEPDN